MHDMIQNSRGQFMHIQNCLPLLALTSTLTINAATLVDTGSPETTQNGAIAICNNGSWCQQSVALQVSLPQKVVIQSVEAWLWSGTPGELTFSLYSDNGSLPSVVVESTVLGVSSTGKGWSAVNGLSWNIDPGTYWAAFEVRSGQSFYGALEFPAPVKLPAVVKNDYYSVWKNVGGSAGGGIRIYGEALSAVPESGAGGLAIAGAALIIATHRRLRHSAPNSHSVLCNSTYQA